MSAQNNFLESVARYIMAAGNDHRDTLMLFPNKRAIIYMRGYLKRYATGPVVMPRMRTLRSFLEDATALKPASRVEQIFDLYDAYCEVALEHEQTVMSFDRFRFWGDMLLKDFDDIDSQLVNPSDIFTNLKRLQEIQTFYLDEEQREVAKEIWGYDPGEAYEGFRNSAKRKEDGEDLLYAGFIRLSEMLLPIYERYHLLLSNRGLSTRGMVLRQAATCFDDVFGAPRYEGVRFVFVGFDVLNKATRHIFRSLKNLGRADYFWDVPDMLTRDLPSEMKGYASPLKKYIDSLVRDFPMPNGYVSPRVARRPEITVVAVPSNTLQAKIAGNVLEILKSSGQLNPFRADNTAIVLPDASLLTPLLHSVRVSPINVTMGLPIRQTPFATLLQLIIKLNMSGRADRSGEYVFLSRNVVQVLSHPSLAALFPDETASLRRYVESKGEFVTRLSTIAEKAPSLAFVFSPADKDAGAQGVKAFMDALIDGLLAAICGDDNVKDLPDSRLHELLVLRSMRTAVDTLVGIVESHSRYVSLDDMKGMSFYRLVEKQLFTETLNFSGSPLKGVQIMGALETRLLDFDNVVVLSLNEKNFPPRRWSRSFLPSALRGAFGLPMAEEIEIEYGWIYANLTSRCRRAWLMYNTSPDSVRSGGMSRYLFQTRYLYNLAEPHTVSISPRGLTAAPYDIVVEKNADVMARLDRFRAGGDLALSVSALEKYAACPLRFYLSKVRNVAEPKSPPEAIDAITQGNVVHAVVESIYDQLPVVNNGIMDERFNITDAAVKNLVAEYFDRFWYYRRYKTYENLPSQGQIMTNFWYPRIVDLIRRERQRPGGPYAFVKNEFSPADISGVRWFEWKMSDDLTVRFTFFVDRVDRIDDNTLRFIDYKTGPDGPSVYDMDSLFFTPTAEKPEDRRPQKVIFQLLAYANAYEALMANRGTPFTGDIVPELTNFLDLDATFNTPLTIGGQPVLSHRSDCVAPFLPRFKELVASVFDPSVPFTQTADTANCEYCQFKGLCQRAPKRKYWQTH